MSDGLFKLAKSKINGLISGFKKRNPSIPAVIILVLTVVTLIIFEIIDIVNNPTSRKADMIKIEKSSAIKVESIGPLHDQLSRIIEATTKFPFKADIITNEGLKEHWLQSGKNCRFEDPLNQNIVILNYSKKKLWIVNLSAKTASEITFDTSTAEFYTRISPALLLGGFINTDTAQTMKLEDLLPSNSGSKLTFTKEGLPDRWEGFKNNHISCFLDWRYTQINKVIPTSEFELPQNITVETSSTR